MSAKTKSQHVVMASVLLALAAVVVVPSVHVRAQANSNVSGGEFIVNGFQADSSSPFNVQGDLIGKGVWQHMVGPILGGAVAMIPGAPPNFGGVGCQPEYSQDEIVTQDTSTITVNVIGTRCQQYSSPGAHSTTGIYSLVGGTGRFQGATHGTGTVTVDTHADGSASIHIGGFLRICAGGTCSE